MDLNGENIFEGNEYLKIVYDKQIKSISPYDYRSPKQFFRIFAVKRFESGAQTYVPPALMNERCELPFPWSSPASPVGESPA